MKNSLSTGVLVFVASNFLAGCSYLPKFPEPQLGAAQGSSAIYESRSALTVGGVHFDSEAATLHPDAHKIVARAVLYLSDNPDSRVIVEGHTDHTGSESYNQKLSEMRAGTVVRALRARGISADRITSIGHGESKPVADNKTSAGKQANRRVEIIFQ